MSDTSKRKARQVRGLDYLWANGHFLIGVTCRDVPGGKALGVQQAYLYDLKATDEAGKPVFVSKTFEQAVDGIGGLARLSAAFERQYLEPDDIAVPEQFKGIFYKPQDSADKVVEVVEVVEVEEQGNG